MTILDRYIIRSFIRNYLLSFVVLVGMYVAIDMIFNFDELARGVTGGEAAGTEAPYTKVLALAWKIVDFYGYKIFAYFIMLSGIIPVAAAAFTLMRMTRLNELTAMLAAGVPLLRIAAPVIAMGMVVGVLVVADQELIIPRIAHKLARDHDEVGQTTASSFPIRAIEDYKGSVLMAARYDPPDIDRGLPAKMHRLDIIGFDEQGRAVSYTQAKTATFDPSTANQVAKVWNLEEGKTQTGLRPNDPIATRPVVRWETNIGPEEIGLRRRASFVDLLSTAQINQLLDYPRNYGVVPLLRVKHWRIVQPIVNVLLILLAIPCVLTREPTGLKRAALRTVMITGSCLGTVFLCLQLAGNPPTPGMVTYWPMAMLWLPIFIFAPIAVWQLDRVKS